MSSGIALKGLATGVEFQQLTSGVLGVGNNRLVYIYHRGTTTQVSVFSDQALTQPLSQPLTTAADGSVPGFVAAEQQIDFFDQATSQRAQAEPVSAADVAGLLNGTNLPASVVKGCLYASGAYPARPSGDTVIWVGPTQPTGWQSGDLWLNTTGG